MHHRRVAVLRLYYLLCALIAGALVAFAPTCADAQDTARAPVTAAPGFRRRRGLRVRAADQREHRQHDGTAGRHRAEARRDRAHRRRGAQECRPGRHDAVPRADRRAGAGPSGVHEPPLRSGEGLRAGHAGADFSLCAGSQPQPSGTDGPRVRCLDEGARERGHFRDGRCRQRPALLRRDDRPERPVRTWFTCRTRARRRCWPT